jgi:hypothetical protein
MSKTLIAALVAGAAVSAANAAVISSWNTAGLAGTEASLAGAGSPNVTALTAVRGAGLAGNAGGNSMNASGWNDLGANDYFEFGFTVASGFQVNLSSLSIGLRASGTGPGSVIFSYSTGGAFTTLPATATSTAPGANFVNSVYNLSALTNLSGTVTFRLRANGNTSANGGSISSSGTFRITNFFAGTDTGSFRFEGTTIPAPGALALVGLGGLVAGRRRR